MKKANLKFYLKILVYHEDIRVWIFSNFLTVHIHLQWQVDNFCTVHSPDQQKIRSAKNILAIWYGFWVKGFFLFFFIFNGVTEV
jgi:hypothetical protein